MAVRESDILPENEGKSSKIKKKPSKKTFLVAHDLKLARILAGNDKTRRDRALKNLKKWFESRSHTLPFTKDDFLRIWKGLFYSMWMSDKLLVQEDCAENISKLTHSLYPKAALLFFESGLETLKNEWFGIDQLRLDKFLMFVRRLLRQSLLLLKNNQWEKSLCEEFTSTLSVLFDSGDFKQPLGLLMHFCEIFPEELAKVSDGDLNPNVVPLFLTPFIKQIAFSDDSRLVNHIQKHIFTYLICQSDLGLEYEEKYQAWKSLGFPGRSINAMQKVTPDDDDDNASNHSDDKDGDWEEISGDSKVYDPRAGRVDVELPQLKFNAKLVAQAFRKFKFDKGTNVKSRQMMNRLAEQFTTLARGIYPLGVKKLKMADTSIDTNVRKAVNRLVKFDRKLMKTSGSSTNRKKRKTKHHDDEPSTVNKTKKSNNQQMTTDHEKLEDFIRHNETSHVEDLMKKPKKKRKSTVVPPVVMVNQKKRKLNDPSRSNGPIESIFRRNSGTWFVTCLAANTSIDDEAKAESPILGTLIEEELTEKSPSSKRRDLFPKIDWADRSGESKSMNVKSANRLNKSYDDVMNDTLDNLTDAKMMKADRRRLSLDHFRSTMTFDEVGGKKVKINTNLNKSQDVHEHITQILSSPAIPYDANRKPVKPLLKTPIKESPINPFYKRPRFLLGQ